MPTIRLRKTVYGDLLVLCGKIQQIKKKRISPSVAVSLLLRFMKKNQRSFDSLIEKERERIFSSDYDAKLNDMRTSGIPTTKDFTKR